MAFRQQHPAGNNLVVSPQVSEEYRRKIHDMEISFVNIGQLIRHFGH